MGKRIRRNRKRTKKRTKKGGMKKTTPTQFKESRLELKRMLKDKGELDRVSSSSSDELSPKTEYLWKRAMPQEGEVGKDTSEIKEYIDRRLNEQKEEYETKIKNLSSIIDVETVKMLSATFVELQSTVARQKKQLQSQRKLLADAREQMILLQSFADRCAGR